MFSKRYYKMRNVILHVLRNKIGNSLPYLNRHQILFVKRMDLGAEVKCVCSK